LNNFSLALTHDLMQNSTMHVVSTENQNWATKKSRFFQTIISTLNQDEQIKQKIYEN